MHYKIYTAEEHDLIANAILDASVSLNIAYDNLYLMFSEYFESKDSIKHLRSDAEYNPSMIESRISGVLNALMDAKYELDLFMNPDSNIFKSRMADFEEKKKIVAIYKAESERRAREWKERKERNGTD